MLNSPAIDLALSCPVGEKFSVNGRVFTRFSYSVSGYADRFVLKAWNAAGKVVDVTVRTDAKVALLGV